MEQTFANIYPNVLNAATATFMVAIGFAVMKYLTAKWGPAFLRDFWAFV